MLEVDPNKFAIEWCAAWNAHDIDGVLSHFHDDVIFTSPVAQSLFPETGGVLRGKSALRAYWEGALPLIPNLRFSIEAVFAGVDTLVIQYRNQKDVSVSEVLRFDARLVKEGHGTYPVDLSNPAGTKS